MQLSPLFVWFCSQPVSHPWPSAQIYLLIANQLLVCLIAVASSVEMSSGQKKVNGRNGLRRCVLSQVYHFTHKWTTSDLKLYLEN